MVTIKTELGLVIMLDKETETLVKIILLLEPLSDEQKDRILMYLDMRYIPMPEYNFEYGDEYFE